MMCGAIILAAVLNLREGGVELTVESDPETVNPGRNVNVTLTAKAPEDTDVTLPDLTPRLRGFSSAESLDPGPVKGKDGKVTRSVVWKLVPEPCAEEYRIAPFVVGVVRAGKDASFIAGPVRFAPPGQTAPESTEMTVDLAKDEPPLTWERAKRTLVWVLPLLLALLALVALVAFLLYRRRERALRPIDRALAELARLLKRNLPKRGRYKDFYIELTMVVRRYIQRQHGVRAPHLTTEEFFEVTRTAPTFPAETLEELLDFLRRSDLVKFAGVAATDEMVSEAVASARAYVEKDNGLVQTREKREVKHA